MTEEIRNGLAPEELEVADELERTRPALAPGFRGALARYLTAKAPGYGARPPHLRLMVLGYLVAGGLMIGLGALIATGSL